jgi:hypothetical protein
MTNFTPIVGMFATAPVLAGGGAAPGQAQVSAPQGWTFSDFYQFGGGPSVLYPTVAPTTNAPPYQPALFANQGVWYKETIPANGSAAFDFVTGALVNPVNELAQLGTAAWFYLVVALSNPDGTRSAGLVASLNAALGAALGWGGAVARAVAAGQKWAESNPGGWALGPAAATLTLTNASSTNAATAYLSVGGLAR